MGSEMCIRDRSCSFLFLFLAPCRPSVTRVPSEASSWLLAPKPWCFSVVVYLCPVGAASTARGSLGSRGAAASMLVVVGQPAAVLARCVGRRYKLKLCEQHFGRTHVRTCLQGLREASVSPLSQAVGVSEFECRAGFEGFRPLLSINSCLLVVDKLLQFSYAQRLNSNLHFWRKRLSNRLARCRASPLQKHS